ncbi:MAG: FeoB-associated Cys-rich membrane protein [Monoglobales bacterium]
MKDLIVVGILVIVLGLAIGYIIKSKKNGKKCIGCPDSCSCCEKSCPSKDK